MNKKAQAGIEYLMTYGWALILVVTVIGVLVFIVSTPVSDVVFRSSDPTKLMLKGASALADIVQIKLQNITGGKITINGLTSADYQNLTINGQAIFPIEVGAGGEIVIEGNGTVGTITINYTDYSGIERTTTITGSEDGTTTPPAFDAGSGTLLDPFNIRDCAGLQRINDGNLGTYNQLTQSFSCSGIANFDPIGSDYANVFSGNFNGQGFTISGLKINRQRESMVGLFGYASDSSNISNVNLVDINITGRGDVGGLIGYNESSVTNSYSTGIVNGQWDVGGLIGSNTRHGSIINSYSTVNATSNNSVGGLVGYNQGSVTNSYSTGSVIGTVGNYFGGLVGVNDNLITNSYSTGSVTGNNIIGGLVGFNLGTISNGYWYTDNPILDCYDGGNNGCLKAPNAEAFFDTGYDVYDTSAPNWNFETVWQSTGSYPTLQ